MNPIIEKSCRYVANNRRNPLITFAGEMAYKFYRAYENKNFDIATNGERWLIQQQPSGAIMFDVGANVGDWTCDALWYGQPSKIHAFEPGDVSLISKRVNSRLDKVVVVNMALGEEHCSARFFKNKSSVLNSFFKGNATGVLGGTPTGDFLGSETVIMVRGDSYCGFNGIGLINLLKVDVGGYEMAVLNGFTGMLLKRQIKTIQFEYNTTNIISQIPLQAYYKFFEELGYKVGKLYPNYIDWRPYSYRHEDYIGPNMVATCL